MKFWIKVAKAFGYLWITLVGLLILSSLTSIWINEGFGAVREILSPFNIWNYLVTVILLAPAIAALAWADQQEKKN